jgi:hypothetical protein
MIDATSFTFSESATQDSSAAKVVKVARSITTKEAILSCLANALDMPDYFGANWDALDECLRDLSWIKDRLIVIKHDGVPRLPADVLRVYLDVLARAVQSWRDESDHELVVMFPAWARNEITMILKGPVPDSEGEPPS